MNIFIKGETGVQFKQISSFLAVYYQTILLRRAHTHIHTNKILRQGAVFHLLYFNYRPTAIFLVDRTINYDSLLIDIFLATILLDYSANLNYQVCSAKSMETAKVARIQSNFAFNRS